MTLKEYGAEVKRRIKSKNLDCVFLDKEAKRCKVYAVRPMICRLFGAVDHPKLTCPHGCRPEGRSPMISQQAKALLETIRCLQCQGQSIAASDAPLAGDMRHEVRSKIAAGESP